MSTTAKVVRIELEWSDGMIEGAEGDDADRVWAGIHRAFVLAQVHGQRYSGPQLKRVREPREISAEHDRKAHGEGENRA